MNYVQLFFSFMASFVILFSALIFLFESKLPGIFAEIVRYGKFGPEKSSKLVIQVPKSWFKHFYIIASFLYSFALILVVLVYFYAIPVPQFVILLLNYSCGESRISYVSHQKVFIAIFLMTIQVYRRFYETQIISVFAKNSKINIPMYLFGLIYYPGTILAILCEAPIFTLPSIYENDTIKLWPIPLSDLFAILIFLCAWKHQYNCMRILGNLRRNKTGQIISDKHKIPEGDWFNYLSSPHQSAEILMYSCIMWILWYNGTWFFVFSWVFAIQVQTILLSHWWYQEKFAKFPKTRKALIPFIY